MAWAEGALWVGEYRARKIHQVDPETGAILRTIQSNRVVTGVTWVDSELWHGIMDGDEGGLQRIDALTGDVVETIEMPPGTGVSGLEVRRWRPVLLWRRAKRQGSRRPPAEALTRPANGPAGTGFAPRWQWCNLAP